MHVDKKWIKQRPHFLAENLAKTMDVTVLYARANKRHALRPESQINHKAWPIFQIPFRHIKTLSNFNQAILLLQYLLWIVLIRPTHVLVPLPDMYSKVFKYFGIRVIYDCMDDVLGFSCTSSFNAFRKEKEATLCTDAFKIVTSSHNLARKIENRHGRRPDIVIRNAFNGSVKKIIHYKKQEKTVLAYFGTISHWFDFEKLMPLLEELDVELSLAGPCEVKIPENLHIKYHGILPHKALDAFVEKADILIMPFIINELILSVDPVKLYEYINFGKPIISVKYPEVERFAEFCEFYSTSEELRDAIYTASGNRKYSERQRLAFLSENTWPHRARAFLSIITNNDNP